MIAAFTGPKPEFRSGNKSLTADGAHLGEVFLQRISLTPYATAFLSKQEDVWVGISWGEVFEKVCRVVAWLHRDGRTHGDRIAIFSNNRLEWALCDAAGWGSGMTTVPIYQSSTPEDIAYMLEHSGAKVVFAEDAVLADRVKKAKGENHPPIVLLNSKPGLESEFTTFASIQASEDANAGEKILRQAATKITGEDIASIVYTSGTTGRPKGAMIRHSQFTAELRSAVDIFSLTPDDKCVSFLPLAHVLGRIESLMPMFSNCQLAFAESIALVAQNMVEVHPTVLVSVPRIYEKIYAKIQGEVASSSPLKQKLFRWAVELGRDVQRKQSEGIPVPLRDSLRLRAIDRAVFKKVRDAFGGRIRFTISGGAPLSRDIAEFFHACGVPILEGYGLTETTGAAFVNRPGDFGFGTVGRPIGFTEARIASDGEILLRGPVVSRGYYNDAEATAQTFLEDGWFATGDIGDIDARGRLRITDRKKELIVTSGGKNVAPQKIENLIKQIRFVNNAVVVGDRQKYLAVLLTLNEGAVRKWAEGESEASPRAWEELAQDPKLESMIQTEIKAVNSQLASYESIKRFKILPKDFTVEGGELTPSLKVKRRVITKHYEETITQMFS